MEIIPDRNDANKLLNEHIKEPYLLLHSKMVAKVMEDYAVKFNEDSNLWYITGLLHDLDYEQYPKDHPDISVEWLKQLNYDQRIIHAIQAHATKLPRVEPQSSLAKCLIAVDELCGLLYAYSLMRPEGFNGMQAKSALKKFKDKAFAAKIDRDEIKYGVEKLNVEFNEHITFVINSLNSI